jgi:hypothetical protein
VSHPSTRDLAAYTTAAAAGTFAPIAPRDIFGCADWPAADIPAAKAAKNIPLAEGKSSDNPERMRLTAQLAMTLTPHQYVW